MSFLSQIQQFNKTALQPTTTVVTTAGGLSHTEQCTERGFEVSSDRVYTTGFVVSNQAREDDESGEETGHSVEVSFNNHLSPPTDEELRARMVWQQERNKKGDGFSVTPSQTTLRCGVFVLSKTPHEEHYDAFAFLLSDECSVRQVDHNDIVGGVLEDLDVIIFPGREIHFARLISYGGLVTDVDRSLGIDGAAAMNKFVYNGGGYFGVCAGAFIAAADGYDEHDEAKRILPVTASWIPGIGCMKIKTSEKAGTVFGDEFTNTFMEVFWANGPIFQRITGAKNSILGVDLTKCDVLATTHSITHDDKETSLVNKRHNIAALSGVFGSGRIVIFGPHPEASGLRFKSCIVNSIMWCGKKR
jgi:hypothetical protein